MRYEVKRTRAKRGADPLNKLSKPHISERIVKTAYIVDDPALGEVMKVMSPAHMSFFKQMMGTGLGKMLTAPTRLFRAGTVLGLSFMVRNPIRDQLMAATLTKYGYTPVIDWFRGMYHAVAKTDVYNHLQSAGGTQASFLSDDIAQTANKTKELTTGETLSGLWHKFLRKETGEPITMRRVVAAVSESNAARKRAAYGTRYTAFSPKELESRTGRVARRAKDVPIRIKEQANGAMYALRRVSELAEEATRTGAAARAISKAKKGIKYTRMRALDDALGGLSGWAKMIGDKKFRAGFPGRWRQSRYTKSSPYMKVRGKEKLAMDADIIDEVRNITLDFQRKGSYGEALNAFYPFFNAEIQDYARFSRAFKEAPLTTSARAFTFVTLPAMANWYMNFDDPNYQNLPDIEKELFMHPFGYNPEFKKFGRVSRPIGTLSGAFGVSAHKTLDWLAANDPAAIKAFEETLFPGESLRRMRDQFREGGAKFTDAMPASLRTALSMATMSYFPMHGIQPPVEHAARVEGDPFMKDLPFMSMLAQEGLDYIQTSTMARYISPRKEGNLLASIAPQFAAPGAIIKANYDPYFDAPVVPPRLASANLEPEDVYTEQTMPLEHMMAKALRMLPGLGQTNPIQAGFLWRRYTGSLGSMLLNQADMLMRETGMAGERPSTPRDATQKNPLVKPFYGRSPVGGNSKPVRELYDEWERVERVLNSMEHNKQLLKAGRLTDIMKDHPEWAAASLIEQAVGDLSAIHKQRRKVLDSYEIEDDVRADRLYELDQGMTQYAYIIMMAYNAMVRDPELGKALTSGFDDRD